MGGRRKRTSGGKRIKKEEEEGNHGLIQLSVRRKIKIFYKKANINLKILKES